MRPRLYAWDHNTNAYDNIKLIADVDIVDSEPKTLSGYDGLIVHSGYPEWISELIPEINKRRVHLFCQMLPQESFKALQSMKKNIDDKKVNKTGIRPELFSIAQRYSDLEEEIKRIYKIE